MNSQKIRRANGILLIALLIITVSVATVSASYSVGDGGSPIVKGSTLSATPGGPAINATPAIPATNATYCSIEGRKDCGFGE